MFAEPHNLSPFIAPPTFSNDIPPKADARNLAAVMVKPTCHGVLDHFGPRSGRGIDRDNPVITMK
jgi:hypothetical protein